MLAVVMTLGGDEEASLVPSGLTLIGVVVVTSCACVVGLPANRMKTNV